MCVNRGNWGALGLLPNWRNGKREVCVCFPCLIIGMLRFVYFIFLGNGGCARGVNTKGRSRKKCIWVYRWASKQNCGGKSKRMKSTRRAEVEVLLNKKMDPVLRVALEEGGFMQLLPEQRRIATSQPIRCVPEIWWVWGPWQVLWGPSCKLFRSSPPKQLQSLVDLGFHDGRSPMATFSYLDTAGSKAERRGTWPDGHCGKTFITQWKPLSPAHP